MKELTNGLQSLVEIKLQNNSRFKDKTQCKKVAIEIVTDYLDLLYSPCLSADENFTLLEYAIECYLDKIEYFEKMLLNFDAYINEKYNSIIENTKD